MRSEDIKVSTDYAYIDPDFPQQPLRATALAEPENGVVEITVHHPDTGDYLDHVATRTLHGPWSDKPEGDRWKAHRAALRSREQDFTWTNVAQIQVDAARRQRALARRLADLAGIHRLRVHYAGRGGDQGSETSQHSKLQLNWDELEELLSRAENGPGYVPRGLPQEVSS